MADELHRFRLTGSYGGLEVQRHVDALDMEEAYCHTGVAADLENAGWQVLDVEGDFWTIEQLDPDDNVLDTMEFYG